MVISQYLKYSENYSCAVIDGVHNPRKFTSQRPTTVTLHPCSLPGSGVEHRPSIWSTPQQVAPNRWAYLHFPGDPPPGWKPKSKHESDPRQNPPNGSSKLLRFLERSLSRFLSRRRSQLPPLHHVSQQTMTFRPDEWCRDTSLFGNATWSLASRFLFLVLRG